MPHVPGDLRRWAITVAALFLTLSITAPAVHALGSQPPSRAMTVEELLAVNVQATDLAVVLDGEWWQGLPGFTIPGDADLPGFQIGAVQDFDRLPRDPLQRVSGRLTMFDSDEAAAAGLQAIRARDAGKAVLGPAPHRPNAVHTQYAQDDGSPTQAVHFVHRSLVGEISIIGQPRADDTTALDLMAMAVITRYDALQASQLLPPEMSADLQPLMPSLQLAGDLGILRGFVDLPVESWALVDTSGGPEEVRDRLRARGAVRIGFGSFDLGTPRHSLDVALFPFNSAASAEAFVHEFIDVRVPGEVRLDPGATGSASVFSRISDTYELQFAKGRLAADVQCYGWEGSAESACELAARTLAERWYAALPDE